MPSEPLTVWYHGTTAENAASIRREGFRAGTYVAAHLEDAFDYGGGDHILEVAISSEWGSLSEWQMKLREAVLPGAIVAHYVITRRSLYANEKLRKRVFKSRRGATG